MKNEKNSGRGDGAALLTGTLAMGGCSSDSGKLVMVTEAGFAPYEYYDGEAVVGVDVDIAKNRRRDGQSWRSVTSLAIL